MLTALDVGGLSALSSFSVEVGLGGVDLALLTDFDADFDLACALGLGERELRRGGLLSSLGFNTILTD